MSSRRNRRGRGTYDANEQLSRPSRDPDRQLDFFDRRRSKTELRQYNPKPNDVRRNSISENRFATAQTSYGPRTRSHVVGRGSGKRQNTAQRNVAVDWYNAWQRAPLTTAFVEPKRQLSVCVARQRRKEVLHAFKQTGRGRGQKNPPRFTAASRISCKRK